MITDLTRFLVTGSVGSEDAHARPACIGAERGGGADEEQVVDLVPRHVADQHA